MPRKASDLKARSLKSWQRDRFGMFIHWGAYSVGGLDCWKMHDLGIPVHEYVRRFARRFHPRKFDARALVRTAKSAGCRYIVMGSRHHEGYCLWNTATTRYASVHMAPKRDFIGEYVRAARGAGLKIGFYYSMLDWRYRSYFAGPRKDPEGWRKLVRLVHAQVRELMTNYGKIDILWYDGGWPALDWGYAPSEQEIAEAWQSRKLNAMVAGLQPGILINNRSYPHSGGDFGTPEQHITPEHRPWELCDTIGALWGYAPQDRNRKPVHEIVNRLITCVSLGGNMLLNIGPRPDGAVQKWQAAILARVGAWLKKHGEAIYGCGAEWSPLFNKGLAPWRTTRKGNTLYLHLLRYPGTEFGIASFHEYHLVSARILTTGAPLEIVREPTRDLIRGLPARPPDPIATVLALKIRPKTAAEKRSRAWIGLEDPEKEEME